MLINCQVLVKPILVGYGKLIESVSNNSYVPMCSGPRSTSGFSNRATLHRDSVTAEIISMPLSRGHYKYLEEEEEDI